MPRSGRSVTGQNRTSARRSQILIAVDNDAAGDAIAARIRATLDGVAGLEIVEDRSPAGKDWNDALQATLANSTRARATNDFATLNRSSGSSTKTRDYRGIERQTSLA
jgi:DNA primase